jgi:hypothetical protein
VFTFGSFLKITEVVKIYGLLFLTVSVMNLFLQKNGLGYTLGDFSQCISCAIILTKNGLGYTLGDFSTNSSGRPDRQVTYFRGDG